MGFGVMVVWLKTRTGAETTGYDGFGVTKLVMVLLDVSLSLVTTRVLRVIEPVRDDVLVGCVVYRENWLAV